MITTTLGRTGRTVSAAGLGCGGSSRVGLGRLSTADSVRLVRAALDAGVSLLDTAEAYGTEDIVGRALEGVDRDRVTVSTKSRYRSADGPFPAARIVDNLHASLRRLRCERVDVFHVHAVRPNDYAYVMDEIVPVLLQEKARGTIAHLGITETSPNDPRQVMMTRAVRDADIWEVVMFAFHLMHHAPRRLIFPHTEAAGIGTLIMFAVRSIFSRPERLSAAMVDLAARGKVAAEFGVADAPLAALMEAAGATSLTEFAYRFARHEPGADVVLFGTGNPDHLAANIDALNKGPLPDEVRATLAELFGHLYGVGLDLPDHMQARPR